jgi:acetyl esterase/lipase
MGREILDMPPPPADVRIRYGDDDHHFGDLRLPNGHGTHPVVIGIHGGFWRALYGLDYYGHLCESLRQAGIATWNIEYRRIGNGGGYPTTFLDVANAADHLRVIAPQYNLDLSRVVPLGHSAGGHLALWLASRQRIPPDDPLRTANPLPLKAAIALAGVVDLRRSYELRLGNNVTEEFMGGTPVAVSSRYATASPIELLPMGIPCVLIHGTDDVNVPHELSQRYYDAAKAQGAPVTLITQHGAEHFACVDPRTKEWQEILEMLQNIVSSQ